MESISKRFDSAAIRPEVRSPDPGGGPDVQHAFVGRREKLNVVDELENL